MSRISRSEFAQDVLVKDEVLSYVLRVHLHVERWLHELLRRKLSKPARFLNRGQPPRFSEAVVLCEALDLIPIDLANVIRKLNKLRNDYAHVRGFRPTPKFIAEYLKAMRELKDPFYMSYVRPSRHELCRALAALSGYLQRTAQCTRNGTSNPGVQPPSASGHG